MTPVHAPCVRVNRWRQHNVRAPWRRRTRGQDLLATGYRKLATETEAQKKDLSSLRATLNQEEADNAVLLEELNQLQRSLAEAQARVTRLESEKEAALGDVAKLNAQLTETRKSADEDMALAADALSEAERYRPPKREPAIVWSSN